MKLEYLKSKEKEIISNVIKISLKRELLILKDFLKDEETSELLTNYQGKYRENVWNALERVDKMTELQKELDKE